jgi:hypothetical protein
MQGGYKGKAKAELQDISQTQTNMKITSTSLLAIASLLPLALAQSQEWGQCGGTLRRIFLLTV